MRNPIFDVLLGDALAMLRTLPSNYFHCVVTSPPYWALRDYEAEGMIGLEQRWDEFLCKLLDVFQEVHRVLRRDGINWVNMGDAYAQKGKTAQAERAELSAVDRHERLGYDTQAFSRLDGWNRARGTSKGIDLQPMQLMGQPYRLALTMQQEGWWWRDIIKWRKPNCCPEGVFSRNHRDGEQLLMMTKAPKYFYDSFAERRAGGKNLRNTWEFETWNDIPLEDIWDIPAAKRGGVDHYATFPIELPRRCIKLGSSAMGCCEACGAPQVRDLKPTPEYSAYLGKSWHDHKEDRKKGNRGTNCRKFDGETYFTAGWKPSCECGVSTVPCRVLDPFSGSGTTGLAALELGHDYTGCELNPKYHANSLAELARKALCLTKKDVDAGQLSLMGGVS